MRRIKKYIAKYWAVILLALVCVFGQAMSELAMPDYMSNIVSTGIQGGGFDSAVSPVLSKETYDRLLLFADKKQAEIIKQSYYPVKKDNVSTSVAKTFPKAKEQDIYVLKKLANKGKLNDALIKPMLIVYSVDTMDKDSDAYKKIRDNLEEAVKKADENYQKGAKKYRDGVKKYQDGQTQYQNAKKKLDAGKKQYQGGYTKLTSAEAQMKKNQSAIEEGKAKYRQGLAQYQKGVQGIQKAEAVKRKLDTTFGSQKKAVQMAEGLKKQIEITTDPAEKGKLQGQLQGVEQAIGGYKQLEKAISAKAKLIEAKTKLEEAKKKFVQYEQAKKKIVAGKARLAAVKKKLDAGEAQLRKVKKKLDDAKKKIEEGKEKLKDGKEQIDEMKQKKQKEDLFYFFGKMSVSKRKETFKDVDKQLKTMGEYTIKIASGKGVKNEYQKLGADVDHVQNAYIQKAGIKMVLLALFSAVAAVLTALFGSRTGAGVARDLRFHLFKKVESFSSREIHKFSTASLITRSTNDITQVQQVLVIFIRLVIYAPILGIGALIQAIKSSPSLTWTIALTLVILMILIGLIFGVATPKFKVIQTMIDKVNLSMRENLQGLLVIRAFGNEKESEKRFDKANVDLTRVNLFVNRVMFILIPVMTLIMNGVTLAIIYVGAHQVDKGNIAIGGVMAFLQYGMMIIMAFLMVAIVAIMLPRASVSAGRIADVLETENSIKEPEAPVAFEENKKGLIEFEQVEFSYPGASEPVLSDITFTAHPGETTAFIGSTGSGKSTLMNLVLRFYDVTKGRILIDGVPITEVGTKELRDRIGLVPQKGNLFSGTIRSNILYGAEELSEEELSDVIRVAQADDFIAAKEKGMDSEISQGGANVSGGQKQRLAIARAIAKHPEILVFDDSFSALDFKTDAALRKELNTMCKEEHTTVLLVGQRIASIMHAEQIIVLEEGRIAGKGTHKELMEQCSVYQEIAYSQLSKEELADEQYREK